MRTIDESGISPTPWRVNEHAGVCDRNAEIISGQYGPYNWANASLIASAPELYECLREAVVELCHAYCEQYQSCGKIDGECFVQKWRKALAKASGEETK